jgi:EAL domain-containing protein (putative c-di-GMP-specific phosphodiesterase class I)
VFQHDDLELSLRKGQMNWVTRITDALQADRLELYCQRIQPLQAGRPERCEILVRMRDLDGELVPPMAFIPAAERYNLMQEIDRWVIRNTCAALTRFVREDLHTVFNINLSGLSLSDKGLPAFILKTTRAANIPPHRLCFEITETAAINSLDTMLTLTQELLAHGFTFSLDDFGSGLSSFTYLKTLPVQQIKIDGSFVLNMLQAPLDQTMVRTVIDIGHILDISVCAESVENNATLEQLKRMGVDYAQGYGVERPRPLREFLAAANQRIEA